MTVPDSADSADFANLTRGFTLTGTIREDVPAFLRHHDCAPIAAHCADVAAEARRVAARTGTDPDQAEIAGWLHDVSAVIPSPERAGAARRWGVEVLPEEDIFPMILHQKLSVVLAREIFGVTDTAVLSAVGCHTTLKAGASRLDKVVFVADKIAWDQSGDPPYLPELRAALDQPGDRALDHAALVYVRHLWDQRESLRVVHPWLRAAYEELSGRLEGE